MSRSDGGNLSIHFNVGGKTTMATQTTNKAIDEAQIRQLVEDWVKAVRTKDIDRLMSSYAPDILLFDIQPPLEHRGTDAYRKVWEQCFPCFQGEIDFEIRDLSITVGDEVAFSHSFSRMGGTTTTGQNVDHWVRATVGYCKIGGKWRVTHEHVSVPIDMETGKALFNLKP
jgi:uncharacterized protein (TIGR02246 family)